MKYIKLCIIFICRGLLRMFYVVPVKKNRIYFSSNLGQSISCNPLYIYQYMQKMYGEEYEYIWEYRGKTDQVKKTVQPGTWKSIYYLMTSKVIISNDGLGSYIPKRRKQTFINTWHGGGAYKKSGVDFITDQHPVDLKINQICGGQTDIFLSSSEKFSEVMAYAKMVSREKFMECGMPRNDLLICGSEEDVAGKVKKYFGISAEKKIVLFAPTYRGEEQTAQFHSELEMEGCLRSLRQRFGGEWVFFMRKHHFVKTTEYGDCINASDYPDMQELLYAADVFITDYSSTIWDYSLMFKPGFLFTPDIDQYGTERSFYTDPSTWAFPLARTNEELQELIETYDEEQNKVKIKKHHELLKNKETGKAAAIVVEKIIRQSKENV